jgi:hypothetical protein
MTGNGHVRKWLNHPGITLVTSWYCKQARQHVLTS